VSRGLQVETDELIRFSNGGEEEANNNNLVDEKDVSDQYAAAAEGEEEGEYSEDEDDARSSVRTAEEQLDYLEGLEPCPCYFKCCIDSVVTLFCVTLLG